MKKLLALLVSVSLIISNLTFAEDSNAPLRIGALMPLSGWAAMAGVPELAAIELAVEDINKGGGIKGRNLELIVEDNRSLFRETTSAFTKLAVINGVDFVLGPPWAEFSEIAAPLAERYKVVMITPSGYTDELTINKDFVFTLWPKFSVQTQPLAEHLKSKGYKKIALIYSINAFYEGISKSLLQQMKAQGTPFAETFTFNPEESDFRSIIKRLKSGGFDALVLFLLETGENAVFLKQARELKFPGKIYGGPGIMFDNILSKDMSVADGIDFLNYYRSGNDKIMSRFKKKTDVEATYSIGKAYDSVFLLKEAMERCGFDTKDVARCLKEVEYQGVSGLIKFDPQGNISSPQPISYISFVENGEVKSLK